MLEVDHKQIQYRRPSYRAIQFLTSLPVFVHYLASVALVAISTVMLLELQRAVALADGVKKGPAFIALYLIAIAICTFIGGFRTGIFALILSFFATAFFLIPPIGFTVEPTMTNYMTLVIVLIVGLLVLIGTDAYRNNTNILYQNMKLLSAAQARADQEAVTNLIGQAVRISRDPVQVQAVAVSSLGKMLMADLCYLIDCNPVESTAAITQYWRRDGQVESDLSVRLVDPSRNTAFTFRKGQTIAVTDLQDEDSMFSIGEMMKKRRTASAIFVPISSDIQSESTLVVAMTNDKREWARSEIMLAETVASQTKSAVYAARLQMKEHNIAIQLQAALQPDLVMAVPGVDVSSFYRAALDEANVGGDFYDGFSLKNGQIIFVVGDVSGKGLAAASQVAAIRHMLRCLLQSSQSFVDAIEQLNDVLISQSLLPAFATLFVAAFDPISMKLEYVSCGHEPAFIYRQAETIQLIELPANGPVIGVFEDSRLATERLFACSSQQVHPGDILFLYTDGVSDAGKDTSSLLGVSGVMSLVDQCFKRPADDIVDGADYSASRLINSFVEAVDVFATGILRDDICCLLATFAPDYHDVRAGQLKTSAGARYVEDRTILLDQTAPVDSRYMFVADALNSATEGKLRVVRDPSQLPPELGNKMDPVILGIGENVRLLRRSVREAGRFAGLNLDLAESLEVAAGEAANNSLIHGEYGTGMVTWSAAGIVQVRIEDSGKGITLEDLPRATLERGYTTAGSLGQGFWIILQSVNRCWISTSASGTIIVLENDNDPIKRDTLLPAASG